MHRHDRRTGAIARCDFFQRHRMGQRVSTRPAPILWHDHPEQTELPHAAHSIGGKSSVAIPGRRVRRELLGGEGPRHIADHGLFDG